MPVHNTSSAVWGLRTSGLPLPSRKPNRLRAAAPGSVLGKKPSMLQRIMAYWAVFFTKSRRAFWQVSGERAQIWRLKSPSHHSAASLSLGKRAISIRCLGFLSASPKRASNRLAPTDTVMVRPSGRKVLPKRPLPAGGSLASPSGNSPPRVRNSMRAVRVRNRFSSWLSVCADTSNAAMMANG